MEPRCSGKAPFVTLLLSVTALSLVLVRAAWATTPPARPQIEQTLTGLAVPFVENAGQIDPAVVYYASTFSGKVFVTRHGQIVYDLPARSPNAPSGDRAGGSSVTESFVGGRTAPVGRQPAAARVSFFLGNDPARWRAQVPTYAEVGLGEVYPGIDVTLKAHGKQVEKIFTVQPGAAPDAIRVRVAGAQGLALGADGALVVHTGVGEVRLTPPVAYQEAGGQRQEVDVAYTVAGDRYGFRVVGYDPTRPLVIDPLLQATYLGGSGYDQINALAINATTGDVYAAGFTTSTDFPGTAGGAQTALGGGDRDAFVARLNATLTTLEQATYLGGNGLDEAQALAIDGTTGEVYVAGDTASTDLPGTSGGAQSAKGSGPADDAFVARLNASLTTLNQATYLGGNSFDPATAVEIHPTTGEVYVAGFTLSTDFPGTSGGAQSTKGSGITDIDTFVARLNASLTTLNQATYLGGTGFDLAGGLAIHPTRARSTS
jgi:hypothetical protein